MELLTIPQVKPQIKFIDLEEARLLTLPDPWPWLIADGFHPDLLDRVYAHLAYFNLQGWDEANAEAVLSVLGQSFLNPFDSEKFSVEGESQQLKLNALLAISELSRFYGDRVPAIVWESFAHLATRDEPELEKSILKEAEAGLPSHYTIVDSCLHAAGLVYTFMLHVNSVMFARTGRVLNHNCDCSCSLVNLIELEGSINYVLPRENIEAATQSLLTHFLAETVKLQELFLPFSYSITPEAAEIQGLM